MKYTIIISAISSAGLVLGYFNEDTYLSLSKRAINDIVQAREIQNDYGYIRKRGSPSPPKSRGSPSAKSGVSPGGSSGGGGTVRSPSAGLLSDGSFSSKGSPRARRAAFKMEGANERSPSPPKGRNGLEVERHNVEFGPQHQFAAMRAKSQSPRGGSQKYSGEATQQGMSPHDSGSGNSPSLGGSGSGSVDAQ